MTCILYREYVEDIINPPFDSVWKEKMNLFCNKVYSLTFEINISNEKSIIDFFVYIYNTLVRDNKNFYIRDNLKMIVKFLKLNINDNEIRLIINDIDNTYYKFLDLFTKMKNKEIKYMNHFLSKKHLLFGYIVGSSLKINPILACFLFPYGGVTGINRSNFVIRNLSYFRWIEIHSILHDSFGVLKHDFNIGPGYLYMYEGNDNDDRRKIPIYGNIQIFKWKNLKL